jgi:hypothetical protein
MDDREQQRMREALEEKQEEARAKAEENQLDSPDRPQEERASARRAAGTTRRRPTSGTSKTTAVARSLTRLRRSLLLAPGTVTRAAARAASDPRERWMLQQPFNVRRSFVRDVLDGDSSIPPERREEIWMLLQSKAVRESYVRDVLNAG